MVDRFYGTLYVSNSEMHRDKDWVRASDYDAAEARICELERLLTAVKDDACGGNLDDDLRKEIDDAMGWSHSDLRVEP